MLTGGWRAPSPATSDSDWVLEESTEQEIIALAEAMEKGLMEAEANTLRDSTMSDIDASSSSTATVPTTEASSNTPVRPAVIVEDSDGENECLFDIAKMESHQESYQYDMAAARAAVFKADVEAISTPASNLLNPALLAPRGMDGQYHPKVSGDSYLNFLATIAQDHALLQAAQNMAAVKAAFEAGRSGAMERTRLGEAQGSRTTVGEPSDSEEEVSFHPQDWILKNIY